MDKKNNRVIIVDFNHMAHTYMNSGHRLTKTVKINGEQRVIDTTVQNGTIKCIHRWSRGGKYPTAVCFDSPVPSRKAYFAKMFDMGVEGDNAYKGSRAHMSNDMFEAITMVQELLVSSGVSCYKGENYEADDLIFACIEKAKIDYPDYYIDVITNDADLLPLVDDRVSVFLRSKKNTWAEFKEIEKLHYIQVTPDNFQEVVEDLSSYRKFLVPYNSLLLHKLIRGDSSDNISNDIKKLYPPKKWNMLIETMLNNGVDFSSLFRYGKCKEVYVSRTTGKVVDINTHDRSDIAIQYDDPEELTNMLDTLCWYIEEDEVLDYIAKMYRGMNLNQAYTNLGSISRKPAKIKLPIASFNETELQAKIKPLDINLKLFI